ncbi:MAG: hypothetical protein LC768_01520 [Acidobacteria bacterium]|nr:hypothetical protein [Acidobacteriota bacterium]
MNIQTRHVSSRNSKRLVTGIFMKLLIVEDNLKIRRMIKSIVCGIADRIDECEDGDEDNDDYFRESAREAGAVDYILKENLFDILPIIQQ